VFYLVGQIRCPNARLQRDLRFCPVDAWMDILFHGLGETRSRSLSLAQGCDRDKGAEWGQCSSRRTPSDGRREKLLRTYGEDFELVGIAEGGFRTISSFPTILRFQGWAANEVRRILETRARRVVILASIVHERNLSELVDCLGLREPKARPDFKKKRAAQRLWISGTPGRLRGI
jgi:hypothetical protein